MNCKFAVKRNKGSFNRIASDQTTEQTINRDQKCHGGITGYSTSPATVQRWVLTSHTLAQCQMELEEDLIKKESRPKDIGSSRKEFYLNKINRLKGVLDSWGNPFDERDTLIHICSCVEASDDVTRDLLQAEKTGDAKMKEFWRERFQSTKTSFFSPIKQNKLKTFKNMVVKSIVKSKEKSTIIAAERSFFGRLLILAKSRNNLSLERVLEFSLSPIPWSLGLPDGGMVKTCKSKLLGLSIFIRT